VQPGINDVWQQARIYMFQGRKIITGKELANYSECPVPAKANGKFCMHGCISKPQPAGPQDLASFPGLHAQLLSLAVRKAGEGLDGLIT